MHAGTCVSHRVRPCLRQLLPKPVPKPSGAAVRTLQRPCSQLPRRHGFEPFGAPTDMSKGAGLNSRCAQLCDEDIGGHRSAVHAYGGSCRQFLSQPPRRCTARPAQHGTEARRSPDACSCACGLLLQAIASATPPGHTGTSWRPQMRRQASRRALAHDTAAAAAAAAAATALLCPGLLHVLVLRMEAAAQTARPRCSGRRSASSRAALRRRHAPGQARPPAWLSLPGALCPARILPGVSWGNGGFLSAACAIQSALIRTHASQRAQPDGRLRCR